MKLKNRVLAAVGLLIFGGYAATEIALDRLGYVTTVFPFLPLAWQQKLVSDPVVIWSAGLCFLVAVILLGSTAWNVARMQSAYRQSNERAWQFSGEMAGFKAELLERQTALENQVAELLAAVRNMQAKVANVERLADHTVNIMRTEANTIVSEAAQEATNWVNQEIMNRQHTTETALQGQIEALRVDLQNSHHAIADDVLQRMQPVVAEQVEKTLNERDPK